MNLNRGGVVVPLLFLTLLFIGIYIFNTTLESKTKVDTSKTYNLDSTTQFSQGSNLQLKTLAPITITPTESVTPPSGTGYCDEDTGHKIDPAHCSCFPRSIHCVGGKCAGTGAYDNRPGSMACTAVDLYNMCGTVLDGDGYYCFGKPVIYLYPQKPTFVTVTLSIPGKITESIPEFEGLNTSEKSFGGWQNVLVMPGGILKYQDNYYHELYYESKVKDVVAPDNGVFLSSSNLKQELVVQGEKLGLLPNESLEFADYWFPRLQQLNKPYIFFSILTPQEKEKTDKVTIQPTPDNFIEFIAYFKGVDTQFATQPFVYPKVPQRTGFTAVEWGGTISY